MAFHDTRLPEDVERGARGGPRFNTSIVPSRSGFEKRNANWERSRGRWDIGYGIQKKVDYSRLLEFFYARMGRFHTFRFKDWSDFEISTMQPIATADGILLSFQVVKRYSSGGFAYERVITKLVSGAVNVYLDGVLQTSGFSIDYATGIVSFDVAPAEGIVVQVDGEFDAHVRFDLDSLDIDLEWIEAGGIPNVPVIEVRNA